MESLSFVALYQTSLRGIRWHVWEPGASHATQPLASLLLSLVLSMVPIRDKYQTWYRSQSRRRWATPPSRLFPICALNLQRFVNNPSNKHRFPGWKTTKENHHPNTEPGSSRWSPFDISSPTLLVSKVMCCQLTGLIGMEGRRSLGGTRSSSTSTLGSGMVCGAYSRSLLRP